MYHACHEDKEQKREAPTQAGLSDLEQSRVGQKPGASEAGVVSSFWRLLSKIVFSTFLRGPGSRPHLIRKLLIRGLYRDI